MVYQFGPFRLDSAKRRLWRDGEIVPLTPKALETLIVLVARAGEVVEKDELLKGVWPDTFVEEATLAQNISTLRKALGETSETPTYISTVPRRGYRFLSTDVVAGSAKEAAAPDATVAPAISAWPITTSRSETKSRLWTVVAAFTVMSVIVAIGFRAMQGTPAILTPVVFTIWPPEGSRFSTSGGFMAVSPDGRDVAFVASDLEGMDRLWIRSIASPVPRLLAGAEGAFQPFWSADSKFIAFFADGKLKKIAIEGGAVQTICSVPPGVQPLGGSWNSRDDILFWSNRTGILRVNATGGIAVPAIVDNADDDHVGWPQFLPDQRHFIYVVTSATRPDRTGIYLAAIDSPERSRLTATRSLALYALPGYLLFIENGSLVAQRFDEKAGRLTGDPVSIADRIAFNAGTGRGMFSVSQNGLLTYRTVGDTRLAWFDRAGKALGAIGSAGGYLHFSISPDNTRVAAARIDPLRGTSDIWMLNASGDGEQRLTFDPSWEIFPLWSRDGLNVIFSSNRSGRWEVYRKASSGAGMEEQMVPSKTSVMADDWLSDGRLLVRKWDRRQKSRFLLVAAGGGSTPTELPPDADQNEGRISPDGRWLAYERYEAGTSIYVRPVGSADSGWEVSPPGASEPRWRGDGRELFFLSSDRSLMSVDIQPGLVFQPAPARRLFQTQAVAPSGVAGRAYDVTSDGKQFLVNVPAAFPPITVVVNWTALLQNRH